MAEICPVDYLTSAEQVISDWTGLRFHSWERLKVQLNSESQFANMGTNISDYFGSVVLFLAIPLLTERCDKNLRH